MEELECEWGDMLLEVGADDNSAWNSLYQRPSRSQSVDKDRRPMGRPVPVPMPMPMPMPTPRLSSSFPMAKVCFGMCMKISAETAH